MNDEQADISPTVVETFEHELTRLRKEWWAFLLLGILLILAGVACISYPFFTSLYVMIFLGVVLMVSGVAMIISAFWVGQWSAFLVQILIGLLYLVAGFVIADAPVKSAAIFTLMIAGFFVIAGGFRIVSALVDKYPQWGWVLFNGIITLILGLIIFKSFKQFSAGEDASVFWIIGLLVGIELIFNGWTWVMLSFVVKNLPEPNQASTSQ